MSNYGLLGRGSLPSSGSAGGQDQHRMWDLEGIRGGRPAQGR